MANMAGFDMIGEMALDALVYFIDWEPLNFNGEDVYLFGGEFLLDLTGSTGGVPAQFYCVASLAAVARTNTCQIVLALSNGAMTYEGVGLNKLGGSATVSVVLDVAPDPDPESPAGSILPTVFFSSAVAAVELDTATKALMDGNPILGAGTSHLIELQLRAQLQAWARNLGDRALGNNTHTTFRFTVVRGVDSSDPSVLSASPEVRWIDGLTLGIFGYYNAAATGGNFYNKNDSDIEPQPDDFLFNQTGAVTIVPASRIALLMSPQGFRLVIARPLVQKSVVRPLLFTSLLAGYRSTVQAAQYDTYYRESLATNFFGYFEAAFSKSGDAGAAYGVALEQVVTDANAKVEVEAEKELNAWLDTPAGQTAIANATPPSCGNGSVEAFRQVLPDPLADLVVILNSFSIDLAEGYLSLQIGAGGQLESFGDFSVAQSGKLTLAVDVFGRVIPGYHVDPPQVSINPDPLCEVAGVALIAYFTGGIWGAVIGFGSFTLGTLIASKIAGFVLFGEEAKQLASLPTGPFGTSVTNAAQLKDIIIEPESFVVVGLIARDLHINDFNPRVEIDVTPLYHIPVLQAQPQIYHVGATKWGCPAADFAYTRTYFESAFSATLHAIDLPLPIVIEPWLMEIGNLAYDLPGVLDPRPSWSGEPRQITEPATTLSGVCWFPVPPMAGKFVEKDDISVAVSGGIAAALQLTCRSADGSYYIRLTATVVDGSGVSHTASTYFHVADDLIGFGSDYAAYQARCSALYAKYIQAEWASLSPIAAQMLVPPGAPVENPEGAVAEAVAQAIRAGDPAAFSLLQSAASRYGRGVMRQIGSRVAAMGNAGVLPGRSLAG